MPATPADAAHAVPVAHATHTAQVSSSRRWMPWTGRIVSFLPVAVLLSSAWVRATQHSNAVAEIVTSYGYSESAIGLIVVAECVLVVLYMIPRTAVFAAILMTGYLGGAIATHLRTADTARAAIPLIAAILAWTGLYLRDRRLRDLVPFRRPA
ncbi:MAG: DoxX family protein [Thermoanaerobaculia bacterium]